MKEYTELLSKVKTLLDKDVSNFSDELITLHIEMACNVINLKRNFTPTSESVLEDVYKGIALKLTICSLNKIGAEGETAHAEGGINRTYSNASDYPADILNQVVAKVVLAKT